jgi:hypothetical protein
MPSAASWVTGTETLAVGNCLLEKSELNPDLAPDYCAKFAPA